MSKPLILIIGLGVLCASGLASAQAQEPRFEIVPEIRPTPESRTEPIIDYTCELQRVDGQTLSFTIHYIGRRGYRDPATGDIGLTGASVSFAGSDGTIFSRFRIWGSSSPSRIWGTVEEVDAFLGSTFELEFERTQLPYQAMPPYREGVILRRDSMPKVLLALGYCDQEFTDQSPLSAEEVAELATS